MSPPDADRPFFRPPATYIEDLDTVKPTGKTLKRLSSNNVSSLRAALKEREDEEGFVSTEDPFVDTKGSHEKEETLEEDGYQLILKGVQINSLCNGLPEEASQVDEESAFICSQKLNYKSSNEVHDGCFGGAKRPKKQAGRKTPKKQRLSDSPTPQEINIDCHQNIQEDNFRVTGKSDPGILSCVKAVGKAAHNNENTSKQGCVDKNCVAVNGGGLRQACFQGNLNGGGGGGNGGDDGEGGKPPQKPLEEAASCQKNKRKKQNKKRSANSASLMDVDNKSQDSGSDQGNEVEMDSAAPQPDAQAKQQCQKEQQFAQGLQMVLMCNSRINHRNYNNCSLKECVKCRMVEEMMSHYFSMKGQCSCEKCRLWSLVLIFHTGPGKCHYHDCKVCTLVKGKQHGLVELFPQQNLVNVPACPPSLETAESDIVWKSPEFPDMTHFKENVDYYLSGGVIGKGANGTVYRVTLAEEVKHMFGSCDVVLKKVTNMTDHEFHLVKFAGLHPNLVKPFLVVRSHEQNFKYYIFMERCEMSLKDYIKKVVEDGRTLDIEEVMFYWTQVMDALKYLHYLRIPIVHRDVKADNVLLSRHDRYHRAKLGDYDAVFLLHNEVTRPGLDPKGTLGFFAPEIPRKLSFGRPADIFSCVMLLLQMLFFIEFKEFQGKLRIWWNRRNRMLPHYDQLVGDFLSSAIPRLKEIDRDLGNLIERCVQENPSHRPTAAEIMNHPAVLKYMNRGLVRSNTASNNGEEA